MVKRKVTGHLRPYDDLVHFVNLIAYEVSETQIFSNNILKYILIDLLHKSEWPSISDIIDQKATYTPLNLLNGLPQIIREQRQLLVFILIKFLQNFRVCNFVMQVDERIVSEVFQGD